MKIGNIDLSKEVLIVAEIGNNHEGSLSLAKQHIDRASYAGVHAVKFQTFKTKCFTNVRDRSRFVRLKSFELTYDEFEKLSDYAKEKKLLFLSTPLDLESAAFLSRIVPAFKIASGDNTFYPLIEKIAAYSKPIILSAGLATVNELSRSIKLIRSIWKKHKITGELAILHCVSSYPVPPNQANLGAIAHLQKKFNCTVGYSDHTTGIEACVLAVALGARIIEKHFTIDKNYSDFRDHKLSADPMEMKELVGRIQNTLTLLGDGKKKVEFCEIPLIKQVRRSLVAKKDLSAGKKVVFDDIMWTRPSGGLAPGQEKFILGKTLSKAISKGEPITKNLIRSR